MHTKYNSYYNPAIKLKDEINNKFRQYVEEEKPEMDHLEVKTMGNNLDRLMINTSAGKSFLSPTSVLDRYKNFDVLREYNNNMDRMI